jgi:hypothetical protein
MIFGYIIIWLDGKYFILLQNYFHLYIYINDLNIELEEYFAIQEIVNKRQQSQSQTKMKVSHRSGTE